MERTLWKILAFLICAILLFLVPLLNILERQDDIAYNIVLAECNRFVDICRDTGFITPDLYTDFVSRINSTGNTYQIGLSHVKRSVYPVYRQTGSTMVFSGEYEIIRVNKGEEEILKTLFPQNSASVLDKSRRYEMAMGDLFFVEVQNKGKTMAVAIRDMMMFTNTKSPCIFVRAGGMVRNEAY
ncbi:MAG: hypothetical protein GX227_04160 [Clostridiaceae bacterium]|jgi:hypothetical protein|nr:hypothetical protein [Clostridiaceae bacterium]